MIVAGGQILFPRPAIFKRQQLVNVRAGVDHLLVINGHTRRPSFYLAEAGGITRSLVGNVDFRLGFGPVEHALHSFFSAHWQASHSGSSTAQELPHSAGLSLMVSFDTVVAVTAFSFPSVPLSVDFSTWVAERERR